MNYIGSKRRLSSFLYDTISETVGSLDDKVFCDLFAGTGIVGRTFKSRVAKVISNDLEYYSYVLNRNYIQNHRPVAYEPIIETLDALPAKKGFIYRHYSLASGSGRNYFSGENAAKIDAIREAIEIYREDEDLYFFLLASLLESLDKVSNTASVYGSFLKHLKPTAQASLKLQPALFEYNHNSHEVYNEDSNTLIRKISGDILYLDPPYNGRQYGANYHLLNTIARYDTDFTPKGKTGTHTNYNRSMYCKTKRVHESFDQLIRNANFRYIFLSYNNEGMVSHKDLQKILRKYGHYDLVTTDYKRFKADSNRPHKARRTLEHLHILEKS
ncbi:MAG: modification methylase [Sulfurospirillum sp.]|nr:MAG: modification methylase [Sulfurospirillum sp.]